MLLLALSGCYPDGPEYVDELDIVLTVEDESVDYNSYSSFVMPDSVVFMSNGRDSELDEDQEEFILSEIADRFISEGWTEVSVIDSNSSSDVIILVSILKNTNISMSYGWYGYWDWWYGWGYYPSYGGGYYPYYPGYYSYSSIYSYEDGTLMIEMLDPNAPQYDEENNADALPLIWAGFVNGFLENSQSSMNYRLSKAIDQMFEDSPYLSK